MPRWPEIRAGLIALVMFFGLLQGCPLPSPGKTPAWQRWFVEPIRSARGIVMTPVAWIEPKLRVNQRWSLYQAPAVDKHRMWIEGRDASGQWHLVFRAGDSAHAEDRELIDYTRPRGTWDPMARVPQQYTAFASWITLRVLERHPDFVAARVKLEKVRITDDGLVFTGEFVQHHMHIREESP